VYAIDSDNCIINNNGNRLLLLYSSVYAKRHLPLNPASGMKLPANARKTLVHDAGAEALEQAEGRSGRREEGGRGVHTGAGSSARPRTISRRVMVDGLVFSRRSADDVSTVPRPRTTKKRRVCASFEPWTPFRTVGRTTVEYLGRTCD
jgi:hypothetical protein